MKIRKKDYIYEQTVYLISTSITFFQLLWNKIQAIKRMISSFEMSNIKSLLIDIPALCNFYKYTIKAYKW